MKTTGQLERLKKLSPAKRALLLKAFREEAVRSEASKAIPRRPQQDPPRLSFAQERLWFLDQLEPGRPTYNIPAAMRLTGPLHVMALERSLGEIVHRHEALRTTFTAADGHPVQVI